MTTELLIVGAGGFGRETLDVVEAANAAAPAPGYRLLGVLDDAPSPVNLERLAARSVRYLGRVDDWLTRGHRADYLVAVGQPAARAVLADKLANAGLRAATVVHPRATLGSRAVVGEGTIICAGVQVSANVSLGRHVHLNPSATIGHDTVLADFVSINPSATVSGECRVGAGVLIGAAAVILQGLTVGAGSTVGAAACVTRPVQADVVVMGVPAKVARPLAAHQPGVVVPTCRDGVDLGRV